MNQQKELNEKRMKRQRRTRARFTGSAARPRLSIFRSNRAISVQFIDDATAKTLAAVSSLTLSAADQKKPKAEQAAKVGEAAAAAAKKLGIKEVVFDRGAYRYHGRVKALAEAVRKEGVTF